MALIPVTVSLVNPKDSFVRIFGIWLDKLPPVDWTITLASQNTATHKEFVQSGDLVVTQLDMSDGEHKVYFSISQDEASGKTGIWSGVASFGGVRRPFNRVDVDTFAVFDILVKDGKVVERTNQSTGDDLPTETDDPTEQEESVSVFNKVKGAVKDHVSIASIRDLWNENKTAVLASAGGAGAIIAGVVVWKETRKRRL
jgi:hypothetical protein